MVSKGVFNIRGKGLMKVYNGGLVGILVYLSYLEQYDVLHKVCMYTCSILATQTGIVKQQMITSGKHLHNYYGKSPLLMGNSL